MRNFADINKIATLFIKATFKDSKKVKRIIYHTLYIKMKYVFVFLDITKVADFLLKNADFSRNRGVCHVIHIFFKIFFR